METFFSFIACAFFLLRMFSALWCLDDVPFQNKLPYLTKLPGQIYTIDQQCQHDFGKNSRFCSAVSLLRGNFAISMV